MEIGKQNKVIWKGDSIMQSKKIFQKCYLKNSLHFAQLLACFTQFFINKHYREILDNLFVIQLLLPVIKLLHLSVDAIHRSIDI